MRTGTTKAFLHDTPKDWSSIQFRNHNVKCIIESVSKLSSKAMQRQSFWRVLRIAPSVLAQMMDLKSYMRRQCLNGMFCEVACKGRWEVANIVEIWKRV